MNDNDFDLQQFGLFLTGDTMFAVFHLNDMVDTIGRKLMVGDVMELPNLKDYYPLDDAVPAALKRYYVVNDATRAAEGFAPTWYPHLWRVKLQPLVDSQEYKDILDGVAGEGSNLTLRDVMSTYEKEMQITQAVLDQAEADAPKSGYDTTQFYTVRKNIETGRADIISADGDVLLASLETQATDPDGNLLFDSNDDAVYVGSTASTVLVSPDVNEYHYGNVENGDGVPPNGVPFTSGIAFPVTPANGQFHLRTDFRPQRLFRFNGTRWVKFEDNVRMTMNNLGDSDVGVGAQFAGKEVRQTQLTGFINNPTVTKIHNKDVKEKQSLSKALRPKADD
jgi:hypothetical protein